MGRKRKNAPLAPSVAASTVPATLTRALPDEDERSVARSVQHAARGNLPDFEGPAVPSDPTPFLRGSGDKFLRMQQRAARRADVFNKRDGRIDLS